MSGDSKIELKHIQIFYYKTRELKEKFYINSLSTNCREFYQLLYNNNLIRTIEYTKDENKSTFREVYTGR